MYFMCQATTILLPEYAMHIANIVCTWLHTSRLHGRGRESANLFRGYVQPRGYAHWYIDGSVIHSGQFADIVRQKRCQPYHVILDAGSKGLTCYNVTLIPVAKTTFLHSYVTNDRVEGEMGWFTMIYIHLFHPVKSYPILFLSVATRNSNGPTFWCRGCPHVPTPMASIDWWGDLDGYGCSDPSRPMQQRCHCDAQKELWFEGSKILGNSWHNTGIVSDNKIYSDRVIMGG